MAKAKTQSGPKTVKKEVRNIKTARIEAVDKAKRELETVHTPKMRTLTEGENEYLQAGRFRNDYLREHIKSGWDYDSGTQLPMTTGEGWESIVRLGAEYKKTGSNEWNSFKSSVSIIMAELVIPRALQGAGPKQAVNLAEPKKPRGKKAKAKPLNDADKASPVDPKVWVTNIQAGLKPDEVYQVAWDLVMGLSLVNQKEILSALAEIINKANKKSA